MISNEDCHLGTLDKRSYDKCLKDSMFKERINNINFILSNQIFKGIGKETLVNKFYNFFVKIKISRGEKIICEGQQANFFYLIKEGEFEISTRNNLFELNELIKGLGGELQDVGAEKNEVKHNINLKKRMNEKKKHKVDRLNHF